MFTRELRLRFLSVGHATIPSASLLSGPRLSDISGHASTAPCTCLYGPVQTTHCSVNITEYISNRNVCYYKLGAPDATAEIFLLLLIESRASSEVTSLGTTRKSSPRKIMDSMGLQPPPVSLPRVMTWDLLSCEEGSPKGRAPTNLLSNPLALSKVNCNAECYLGRGGRDRDLLDDRNAGLLDPQTRLFTLRRQLPNAVLSNRQGWVVAPC